MINAILGKKLSQTQQFTLTGDRIPVTIISTPESFVILKKTKETDGYSAVVLTFGQKREKNVLKPQRGLIKKAGLDFFPTKLKEVKIEVSEELKVGDKINPLEILKLGNLVKVTGVSKGKGFAGVMKRHGFAGGPKTHGQSDRQRAPGSIGATTTPGRVLKGKRMAGRMGGEQVAVKNLEVLKIDEENQLIYLKGVVPGGKGNFLLLEITGQAKDPIKLFTVGEMSQEEVLEAVEEEKEKEEAILAEQAAEKEEEISERAENEEAVGQPDSEVAPEATEDKAE